MASCWAMLGAPGQWLQVHSYCADTLGRRSCSTATYRVAPEPWTCALCLVGNQTRWTTHTLAFKRLLDLKETMRGTVLRNHEGGQPLE